MRSVIADPDDEVIQASVGEIRRTARPWPLAPAAAFVTLALNEFKDMGQEGVVLARARLRTDDGEHAALARLAVRVPGLGPVEVTLGLVFGDRAVSRVTVTAFRPAAFLAAAEEARRQVRGARIGLPWSRRRRFGYPMPHGWSVADRGDRAEWRSPDGTGTLAVHAARPESGATAAWIVNELAGEASFACDLAGRVEARFATPRGLEGTLTQLAGEGGRTLEILVLRDGHFIYPLCLESAAGRHAEHRRALERLVDAIEPVPRPAATGGALAHWAA